MTDLPRVCYSIAGYDSEHAFNLASSVKNHLHLIKKPFFFISALDDQMFGPKVIPIGEVHDNILLGVTRRGGHISYLEGGLLPTGQWWTKPTMIFLDYFMK